ncbi:MAG: TrkH family potassium uptake protein [Lachnospiraceae bacterium]|nr:TrkH family potassium uptake protein [Lachnospiraceae bacterium]
MNNSVIRYILGRVLRLEGVFLLLPCLVSLIYQDEEGLCFICVAAGAYLVGVLLSRFKPADFHFGLKEGCIATALSWILMSLVGCLPFFLTGEIPSFFDALFETVSGFTTTGASILSDVEVLSHTALFWRSFTHWIGGMGVLVFLLAVVPLSGGSGTNLMKAESPGPSVGKLVPKAGQTARLLYYIYIGMTIAEMLLLLIGRVPVFDAVTISLGTAGTGGFGVRNSSCAEYSVYAQWVIGIFMMLFGINFNMYYLILFRRFRKALSMEEVRTYFGLIIGSTVVIAITICHSAAQIFSSVTEAFFQVSSIITTTGYSTVDFDLWPQTARMILVCLMFTGACAGSTGGGIKVSRVVLLLKTVKKELIYYIHPKSIKKIHMDGKPIEHDVQRSTNVYFVTFFAIFVTSLFLISFEKTDLVTSFTAVTATMNNIGPGLSMVGPSQNYGFFSNFSKCVLMFDMLAGRLELFPLLILLHPAAWKEFLQKQTVIRKKRWHDIFKKIRSKPDDE